MRALFTRALASAGAQAIDSETLTAELGGTSLVTLTARTLLATCKLLGLPVSAAVITDIQPPGTRPSPIKPAPSRSPGAPRPASSASTLSPASSAGAAAPSSARTTRPVDLHIP
ncbi:MAG: hypothetical protein V9G21_00905 [Methylotenera sp.]